MISPQKPGMHLSDFFKGYKSIAFDAILQAKRGNSLSSLEFISKIKKLHPGFVKALDHELLAILKFVTQKNSDDSYCNYISSLYESDTDNHTRLLIDSSIRSKDAERFVLVEAARTFLKLKQYRKAILCCKKLLQSNSTLMLRAQAFDIACQAERSV